jgi:3-oxoisoapionate kinase
VNDLLYSFYGDDFTGSTDAMESLAANGIPTVLFLREPGDAEVARFPECRAVGMAGVSRSKSPAWMSDHLGRAFRRLKALGAPVCHYKVCSTFDSSPETGSIGRALEIGQEVFGTACVPVVVGAPALGRYVLFGNLFARADGVTYRIDRHPTMKCHPVTPMRESDLRVHLGRQTTRKIALFDIMDLRSPAVDELYQTALAARPDAMIFDVLDEASLAEIGRLVWSRQPLFGVGSSGLGYALIAHWRAAGCLPPPPVFPDLGPVDRLVVVSGSCSPATARQIRWALANGFVGVRTDPAEVRGSRQAITETAANALADGRSVVLYSALGPEDRRPTGSGDELGEQLGIILRELLERSGVRRAVVAGGDTSSQAGQQLGIYAVTYLRPLEPGIPFCRAHAEGPLDGMELLFKGGQVGSEDFFGAIRRGKR